MHLHLFPGYCCNYVRDLLYRLLPSNRWVQITLIIYPLFLNLFHCTLTIFRIHTPLFHVHLHTLVALLIIIFIYKLISIKLTYYLTQNVKQIKTYLSLPLLCIKMNAAQCILPVMFTSWYNYDYSIWISYPQLKFVSNLIQDVNWFNFIVIATN